MKNHSLIMAIVATLVFTLPAEAQTAGAFMKNPAFSGPRPRKCSSTFEMQQCAAHDLRVADAKMSRSYGILRNRLGATERRTLLNEQRKWLISRDRDCSAKYDRRSGSMASLDIALCWVRATEDRAQELNARLRLASRAKSQALSPASFVGRWRGGEGTYMKISRSGARFTIDNQFGLDADTRGIYTGTLTARGLTFRRNGILETVRPSKGDAIRLSALRGKSDCLIVSRDEGYCRY